MAHFTRSFVSDSHPACRAGAQTLAPFQRHGSLLKGSVAHYAAPPNWRSVAARSNASALRRDVRTWFINPEPPGREFEAPAGTGSFLSGEGFYEILGVSPFADARTIRGAYLAMMKDYHPDRSSDPDAGDFCALLNAIYDTLQDPQQRAVYDAIAGYSRSSVNPFKDKTFARDHVFVDEVSCIGCGKCVRACPATFFIEESLYGRARVVAQGVDGPEDIQIAIETCPVDCIHWVSAPQLQLLEVALSSMNRIPAFVMQRSGGKVTGDVFWEAFKAFQRRQYEIERLSNEAAGMAAAAAAAGVNGSATTGPAWGFDRGGAGDGDPGAAQSASGRKIAGLAATAARAARLWRQCAANRKAAGLLED